MGRDDLSDIRFVIAQGTLLWQLILRRFGKSRLTVPSFITPAFHDRVKDHSVDVKRSHGDDPSTVGRNLVSYRSVTAECMGLDCVQQSSIISWL